MSKNCLIDSHNQPICNHAQVSSFCNPCLRGYDSGKSSWILGAGLFGRNPESSTCRLMLWCLEQSGQESTKASHKPVRDLFKQCVFCVQLGMGLDSLALRIGKSKPYGNELLHHHKRVYKKYWDWENHVLNSTLLKKKITTCYGW